ncbi:MAG: hypothetical protein IPK15_24275 [Verrucomicrobia bacterium]|nr:hypothetical protein [Verrucomicrobiota bacterium]
MSDLNDYTRYVPVAQEFNINQGSAGTLVAIFKFHDTTIIAFKQHSIYAISNVYGDLSELRQDELTGEFGLVARKSIAHVGKDLWFLSELGVMSLTQTEQNKLQGVLLPVSDPIQPLIDRINWRYGGERGERGVGFRVLLPCRWMTPMYSGRKSFTTTAR